jgi:hypothetical protein
MGYGGFFKTVVRIAVPAIVNMIPGMQPLGVALAAAAATAATGGSFKESLMAGAVSYIGADIGGRITGASEAGASATALGESINQGTAILTPTFDGAMVVVDASTGATLASGQAALAAEVAASAGAGGLASAVGSPISSLTDTIRSGLAGADEAIRGGISKFTDPLTPSGFGGWVTKGEELLRSPFDVFQELKNVVLDPGTLDIALPAAQASSYFSPIGQAVGGLTSFTLNQALLADTPEADALLAQQGYTPQQIQLLKNEARNALSQEAFEGLQGTVINPGLPEEEFNKILASGVERENVRLGPDITESQFRTVFDDPNLGQAILGEEESLRRQSFGEEIEQAFPGGVFQSLDDDIISSIVGERQGPAQEQISRFGARGNLNPTGGQTANLFIQGQVPEARRRVEEIGSGVLGGYRGDIGEIRGRAEEQAGGYKLGEGLFDVAPFSEERGGLIEERQGTLGTDVRGAIGDDPLFDVTGALRAGGRRQGVVSGQGQNQALLDQIAARELGSTSGRNRRSLGSRGSGAF